VRKEGFWGRGRRERRNWPTQRKLRFSNLLSEASQRLRSGGKLESCEVARRVRGQLREQQQWKGWGGATGESGCARECEEKVLCRRGWMLMFALVRG